MKNKQAWTLVELIICVTVVFIISGALFTVYKPSTQKAEIFLYANIKNLIKGNINVLEKYEDLAQAGNLFYQDGEDLVNNTYCITYADSFSLNSDASCALSSTNDTTNIVLSNGVELRGIASSAKTPYDGAPYSYKNILLDIDGFNTGINKIWVDRFPLRIFAGGEFDGNIQPVNCADDSVYDGLGNKIVLSNELKSPYCGGKLIDFTNDTTVIRYDLIGIDDNAESEELAKGSVIATGLSALQADCLAHGGTGFYHRKRCSAAGYRIHTKCASNTNCESCADDVNPTVCPLNASGVVTADSEQCKAINNGHKKCIVYIHKPSGGMNIILETLIGDIGEI